MVLRGLWAPLLLGLALAAPAVAALEVGRPFPGETLPSLEDGSPVSVRDFRGQKLVVHVFASW